MKTITISGKNQVVIPTAVRVKLGVSSGDKLIVARVTETELVLKKEPTYGELVGTLPTQKNDPVKRVRDFRDDWPS